MDSAGANFAQDLDALRQVEQEAGMHNTRSLKAAGLLPPQYMCAYLNLVECLYSLKPIAGTNLKCVTSMMTICQHACLPLTQMWQTIGVQISVVTLWQTHTAMGTTGSLHCPTPLPFMRLISVSRLLRDLEFPVICDAIYLACLNRKMAVFAVSQ